MITGNVQCSDYEEAKFFDSIVATGLLNIDNDIKEKFKDSKIDIKCMWEDRNSKIY